MDKKGNMTEEKGNKHNGILYGHRKCICCLRNFENKYLTID